MRRPLSAVSHSNIQWEQKEYEYLYGICTWMLAVPVLLFKAN